MIRVCPGFCSNETTKGQVNLNQLNHNSQRQHNMNDAVSHIQKVQTAEGTEYHISLNCPIAPQNGMDIEQASTYYNALSSVITTVSTNTVYGKIDE